MRTSLVLLSLLLGTGCRHKTEPPSDTGSIGTETGSVDLDGDGSPAGEDCDDGNGAVYPGNTEVPYNGLDDDCDEATPDDDLDGDGYGIVDDCDDGDSGVHPGATEVCNELDDDCNTLVDDTVGGTWYADADADGYGDPDDSTQSCEGATGYVADATDCDDAVADVNPGATEVCNGVDDDCDLLIDDDDPGVADQVTWYRDGDEDGYGDDAVFVAACDAPSTYVADGGDCNDTVFAVNPAATEVCDTIDNDCDGLVDDDDDPVEGQTAFYVDNDGDGYGSGTFTVEACEAPEGMAATSDDCDDADALTHPGANETCDSADNNCNGEIDESSDDAGTWYRDGDGDGYGDATDSIEDCAGGSAYVADATDCDDADSTVNPGATEVCNGIDDDCDTLVDDNDPDVADQESFFTDDDGDGYGDASAPVEACAQPTDAVPDGTDCDDTSSGVNPGATEVCNELDDDCDTLVDDDDPDVTGTSTWYLDFDGDGFGTDSFTVETCTAPSGYVSDDTDCEDAFASANPLETEVCDGLDNDCDGDTDDADSSLDATTAGTYYTDADGDGFGDEASTTVACSQPSGTVTNPDDCDDTAASVSPLGTEVCNGVDDDCNDAIDDGAVDESSWYADTDGDGFGDASAASEACDAPSGSVENADDCDDTTASVNPDAEEVCNGVDDDCDGEVDPASSADATFWYTDGDGDGYGDVSTPSTSCEAGSGEVSNADDCDDGEESVNPDAEEICDGVDNNCDGATDESGASGESTWYVDGDGDGQGNPDDAIDACSAPTGTVANGDDCDDGEATINTHATELCDGVDNDCDGTTDVDAVNESTWYADLDGDGYGDGSTSSTSCDAGSNEVANDDDCDDDEGAVNPDAEEVCNGVDDDCDGDIDGGSTAADTWYADEDGDGYGDASVSTIDCDQPSGMVDDASDCDDGEANSYPGAAEVCDGEDNDCDGSLPWLEEDPDSDGLLACEQGLWLKTSTGDNNRPTVSGTHGGSDGAALLTARGITWDSDDWSSGMLTSSLLDNVGILVLYGYASSGSLTSSEATALEDWVSDGGGLLYMGYHPYSSGCDAINALPSAWGLSCSTYSSAWSGGTSTFATHALTEGLGTIGGNGGENWTASSPAETLASVSGYPLLIAIEDGDGKVVAFSDEWAFYDAGTGTYDISDVDNELLVDNIWAWLLE